MAERINFVCEACGFRFRRDKSSINQVCPYCGKQGTVHEELSVSDLLDLDLS